MVAAVPRPRGTHHARRGERGPHRLGEAAARSSTPGRECRGQANRLGRGQRWPGAGRAGGTGPVCNRTQTPDRACPRLGQCWRTVLPCDDLRLPRLKAGDADRLPRRCFRRRDHRGTGRGPSPQGRLTRPVHWPSAAYRLLQWHPASDQQGQVQREHPLRGVCGERVCPARVAVSPA